MSIASKIKPFFSPAVHPLTYEKLRSDKPITPDSWILSPNSPLIAARTVIVSVCAAIFMRSKLKMSILYAPLVACGWVVLEYQCFTRAVRKAALAIFTQQSPVPVCTATYMGTDLEAVKTLIKTPANLAKKCAQTGTTLLGTTLLKTLVSLNWTSAHRYETWLEIFKLLANASQDLDAVDLINMVKWHPRCAVYTLKQNLVTVGDCTAKNQWMLWHFVHDISVMRALAAGGFSIKDAVRIKLPGVLRSGSSSLYEFISHACCLLSLGAQPPALDEKINCRDREQPSDPKEEVRVVRRRVEWQALLPKAPRLAAVFDQARGQAEPIPIPDEQAWIGTRGPVVNIDLSQDQFELAQSTLNSRFRIVLITTFCIALKAFAFAKKWTLLQRIGGAFLASGLISWGCYLFESRRAALHLRDLALKAFRNPFPPHSVARYVSHDLGLVQQLKEEKLNKFDDRGCTLWGHLEGQRNPSFEIFKILADKVLQEESSNKMEFFFHVVRKGQARFVQYLLSPGKIEIKDVPNHFELWQYVNCSGVAKLLKFHGFNLEATNEDGMTPLHASLNAEYLCVPKVLALLAAGAQFHRSQVPNFNQLPLQVKIRCLGMAYLKEFKWGRY